MNRLNQTNLVLMFFLIAIKEYTVANSWYINDTAYGICSTIFGEYGNVDG
jgi:hypothetical protein